MAQDKETGRQPAAHRSTQFSECVFHLEEALVKTDGLESLFEKPDGEPVEAYREKVKAVLASGERMMVSQEQLESIRSQFGLRMGLLSCHGDAWIDAVLAACWPEFEWDFVVPARGKTRFSRGMKAFSPETWGLVVCGNARQVTHCYYDLHKGFAVLATWGWSCVPRLRGGPASRECWREESVFADAQIDEFSALPEVLEDPVSRLPVLERLLMNSEEDVKSFRLLQSKKFGPRDSGAEFMVCGLGRYFPWNCEERRDWRLSRSILEMKESAVFPTAWLQAAALTIRDFQAFTKGAPLVVTVIPARPGRVARLNAFLGQLEESELLSDASVSFAPDLLEFHDGVLSNHHDKLGAADRYANIRDHLFVKQPELLQSHPNVAVIDDVVTTGATLYHAKQFLHKAGARLVLPLAMALTISQR